MAIFYWFAPTNMTTLSNDSWSVVSLGNSDLIGMDSSGSIISLGGNFTISGNSVSGTLTGIVFDGSGIFVANPNTGSVTNLDISAGQAITIQNGEITLNFPTILSGNNTIEVRGYTPVMCLLAARVTTHLLNRTAKME
jgi:hypothetical protein